MPINTFLQVNSGQWLTSRTIYMPQSEEIYWQQSELRIRSSKTPKGTRNLERKIRLSVIHNLVSNRCTDISYFLDHNEYNILTDNIHVQKLYNAFSFLNKKNHLSSIYQVNDLTVFDKLWLVNPNLRLNISVIHKNDVCISIAFSSDIKIA
uniref:Chromophore lyase CpcS/CpeS n=1 Tax=Nemalion sp. H.1444 TaxID=1907586 RepID=A0A1G4NWS8_9FLOR|nr:Hypothetical protein ycf58 [Nemalion sp. H.1444]